MNSQRFDVQIWRQFLLLCLMLFGLNVSSFAAPGDLDLSFGQGGIAYTNFADYPNFAIYNSLANAAAVQPDGKIVVVGSASVVVGEPFSGSAIARYNPDGTLDSTFATGGKFFRRFGIQSHFRSVVIQPDGKILAAGDLSPRASTYSSLIVRYNTDGTLDTSFGNAGVASTPGGDGNYIAIGSILLQSDGKIVAVNYGDYLSAIRYNSDGSLDTSFGVGGKVLNSSVGISTRVGVLQADGKIIVAGTFKINGVGNFALARLNPNGSLDTSFGNNGKVFTSIGTVNSFANGIALQTDGKIVVVGYSGPDNGNGGVAALVRYKTDGSLDLTFGGNGIVTASVDNASNSATSVAIQSNGRILISRQVFSSIPGSIQTVPRILRYNANGSLRDSFGFVGGNGLTLQPDGKVILLGGTSNGISTFFAARYLGDALAARPMYDFDGDGKSDISVFRDGIWHLQRSQTGFGAVYWGLASDKIAPADFDGDGKTDPTVYRPSNGEWSILRSSDNTATVLRFGAPEDLPRPADFDGDGKADITVFRPSNGTWYRINSSNNQFYAVQFGAAGDAPVVADFDGDGKSDIAVYRPSNGTWYWLRSSDGHFAAVQFGISEDKPVPADYDGDGKADVAVFRPSNGTWYLQRSSLGFTGMQFGISTDKPTPADYDGDGKADIAVFRDGTWYLQRSTAGFTGVGFGESTDKPIAGAFIP
jgi:uncharacterized delta-60 repeat protein